MKLKPLVHTVRAPGQDCSNFVARTMVDGVLATGVTPEVLATGLPLPLARYRHRRGWVSSDEFCALADRSVELIGVEGLQKIGENLLAQPLFRYVSAVVRILSTPRDAYFWGVKNAHPHAMPGIPLTCVEVAPGVLVHELQVLSPNRTKCEGLAYIFLGHLSCIPLAFSQSRAEATLEELSDRHRITVRLPPGLTRWQRLRRRFSPRSNAAQLVSEIDHTHAELFRRFAELEEENQHRADVEKALREELVAREALEKERSRLLRELLSGRQLGRVGLIAGGLSHDFSQLARLTVSGVDQALHDPTLRPATRSHLEQAVESALRGQGLAERLVAQGSSQGSAHERVDIAEVANNLLPLITPLFPASIELRLEVETVRIQASRVQVQELLLALLLNARDAMEEGGEVRLVVQTSTSRPGWASIAVIDTGCGMGPELQERVFEPFFSTREGAVGLGLTRARDVARNHGGELTLESVLEIGTRVVCWFPLPS